jgi:hypothetical protein
MIPPSIRLAVTLRYLASGESLLRAFFGELLLLWESTNFLCSLQNRVFNACIFFFTSTALTPYFVAKLSHINFVITVFVFRRLHIPQTGQRM